MQNVLAQSFAFVGCENHKKSLTKTVIKYYIMSSAKIFCKQYNKVYNEAKKDEQRLRKMSKLLGKSSQTSKKSSAQKKRTVQETAMKMKTLLNSNYKNR